MRRALLCGCIGLLLLSSCAKKGEYEPEEVLRRAANASQSMQSARFDAHVQVESMADGGPMSLDGNAKGTLQGNRAAQFAVDILGRMTSGSQTYALKVQADVVAEWQHDLYVILHQLQLQPSNQLLSPQVVKSLTETWWRLPQKQGVTSANTLTPDPRLLQAQAEVVKVTDDKGVQNIHGRDAYRYGVTIDPVKLTDYLRKVAEQKGEEFDAAKTAEEIAKYQATGELWIDASTFYVHRLSWDIRPNAQVKNAMTFMVQLDMTDHDTAPAVSVPPVSTVFPRDTFLKAILSGSSSLLLPKEAPEPRAEEPTVLDVLRQQEASNSQNDTDSESSSDSSSL